MAIILPSAWRSCCHIDQGYQTHLGHGAVEQIYGPDEAQRLPPHAKIQHVGAGQCWHSMQCMYAAYGGRASACCR